MPEEEYAYRLYDFLFFINFYRYDIPCSYMNIFLRRRRRLIPKFLADHQAIKTTIKNADAYTAKCGVHDIGPVTRRVH